MIFYSPRQGQRSYCVRRLLVSHRVARTRFPLPSRRRRRSCVGSWPGNRRSDRSRRPVLGNGRPPFTDYECPRPPSRRAPSARSLARRRGRGERRDAGGRAGAASSTCITGPMSRTTGRRRRRTKCRTRRRKHRTTRSKRRRSRRPIGRHPSHPSFDPHTRRSRP
jgi:hypothetical protein